METRQPNILQMMRAPFLTSILSPLFLGTLLAVSVSGQINWIGFILLLVMGIGLHSATNVYNDIYDTKQGTDRVNRHRNPFSGGSGIIINFPHLESNMFWLARISLIIALLATAGLMFVVDRSLWPHLWSLYLLSAFFSKYYTAAPLKLAYRGWGEISVWFAFGPMAILVAAVSQNVGWHPLIISAMPLTGISTLSILLLGQLIDRDADHQGGKWGVAVRQGTAFCARLYLVVQILLVFNLVYLAFFSAPNGWPLILGALPYALLLPRAGKIVLTYHDQADQLKSAAGINVQLHLLFALLINTGAAIRLFL